MKKTTSVYKLSVKETRPDHYHLQFKAASGELDVVMERSSIRHIIEILDNNIGTGLSKNDPYVEKQRKDKSELQPGPSDTKAGK